MSPSKNPLLRCVRSLAASSLAALSALALGACAPADVAGTYTVAVTNGDNGCMLTGWTVGDSSSGIGFTIEQSGGNVNGTVTGVTGGVLTLLFGSNRFTGSVVGSGVQMSLQGTRAASAGACAFTGVAEIDGALSGDALQGTITYRYSTNNVPDCGYRTTCRSRQSFAGSRPPR